MSHNDLVTPKILVVDDESGIRDGLKLSLQQLGYEVETAASGEEALYQFKQDASQISCVISDFKMPGLDGFDVLKGVKKQSPQTRFILMTGYGSVHHAVSAMQLGADDYLCKPFRVEDLEKMVLKSTSPVRTSSSGSMLSQNRDFLNLLRKAERAAHSAVPILIEGPSGTGKELLAKQIHRWSPRAQKPWIAVNCAALPAGLLESELFGFERGAFTGALERKFGKFEQAHTGTLLLDEIGDLDLGLQAKLLRVLQEGEVDRLGGRKAQKVDVRIIASTNRSLEKLVSQGQFREDLFFRLYGLRFILPALKNRIDDLGLLVDEFVQKHSLEMGREFVLAEGLIEALSKFSWPGNIRQLERAVERAVVLSEDGIIRFEHFELSEPEAAPSASVRSESRSEMSTKSMREMEKEIILEALEAHSGNRTHTARALGMSLRTLRHKIKVYRDSAADRQSSVGKFDLLPSRDAELEAATGLRRDG